MTIKTAETYNTAPRRRIYEKFFDWNPMMMLNDVEYIDISPLLSSRTAVFPGDTPFKREVDLDFAKGDNLLLSHLTLSSHLGAHADAPCHYHSEGKSICERDLRFYLGAAQVVAVDIPRNRRIRPEDFSHSSISASRVLFKTGSFPDPEKWNDDFNAFSPETISFLKSKGVILLGIDTPSVDLADDKELLAHNEIYRLDMAVLEGLVLDHVVPGLYQLIALPLKIEGGDASPVRAVLLKS